MLDVIRRCDQLQWILCTKRPELFFERINAAVESVAMRSDCFGMWMRQWRDGVRIPQNACLLASVENQEMADKRIPELLKIPAAHHGLSCEPLLGPIRFGKPDLEKWNPICGESTCHISWVIIGGESGPKARKFKLDWARSIISQCKDSNVPCFMKQMGSNPWIDIGEVIQESEAAVYLNHKSGADPSEWPEGLSM
jgi:hypothetical protein